VIVPVAHVGGANEPVAGALLEPAAVLAAGAGVALLEQAARAIAATTARAAERRIPIVNVVSPQTRRGTGARSWGLCLRASRPAVNARLLVC
jgi:hypothetical protein